MISRFALLLLICTLVSCTEKEIKKELKLGTVAIIPEPADQLIGEGHFELDENTSVSVENEEQATIIASFFSQFKKLAGWEPKIKIGGNADVMILKDVSLEEEAYVLEVSPQNIQIKASSGAGFFYALQSLKQLLAPSFYNVEGSLQNQVIWGIPSVLIKDKPAFGWRGYMLDVSRHFFSMDQVKKVLDFMAESKLNRFHWHLTDDQGWRVEIKSYPKLTEVGAWRMDYKNTDETISDWWGRPVQKPGEKPTYGGFYTQEDIKEIVAYAKERFIEVIPEIDIPGHAQAAVAAYPEIGCVNAAPFVATGGVAKNNTLNPGKEETFEFAGKMLNEVMDLFPYKYVHIGGDECNKSQWKVDPYAQKRMKEEGLKDENELQSYFIKRIEKIVNKRDRIMIGWDEILEGGLAPNATVMSWRGEKGGIESVKAGHEVIMTPNSYCYIDLKQGQDDQEPNLGYSRLLLSKAYSYQIIPESLSEEEGKLIKGIQANMWTESISDWGKLTYMTFPRLYAIAETGWTDYKNKNWDNFTKKLEIQFKRLDAQNIRYAVSAFSPWIDHKGGDNAIEISLKTEVNELDIRYTLDGSEPSLSSTKYSTPFTIDKTVNLKARAFKGDVPVGYMSSLAFPIHKAEGVKTTFEPAKALTDLNYASLTNADKNWVSFTNGLDVSMVFDSLIEVKEVQFNTLRTTISGVYPPEKVEVYGSADGKNFTKLSEIDQMEISRIQGRNKLHYVIPIDPVKLKALKVIGKQVNPIPEGHHRAGENARIKVDEVVVN